MRVVCSKNVMFAVQWLLSGMFRFRGTGIGRVPFSASSIAGLVALFGDMIPLTAPLMGDTIPLAAAPMGDATPPTGFVMGERMLGSPSLFAGTRSSGSRTKRLA